MDIHCRILATYGFEVGTDTKEVGSPGISSLQSRLVPFWQSHLFWTAEEKPKGSRILLQRGRKICFSELVPWLIVLFFADEIHSLLTQRHTCLNPIADFFKTDFYALHSLKRVRYLSQFVLIYLMHTHWVTFIWTDTS